jgi:hypothetical protein
VRHVPVAGQAASGFILDATTKAKMIRLARHRGYTITSLIEELIESAERRVTTRLTGKALKTYLDGE